MFSFSNYLRLREMPEAGDWSIGCVHSWLGSGLSMELTIKPWFTERTFSLSHLVDNYDLATIHAWPLFTGCLIGKGLSDAPSVHLSAFLTQLSHHAMSQAGVNRPVYGFRNLAVAACGGVMRRRKPICGRSSNMRRTLEQHGLPGGVATTSIGIIDLIHWSYDLGLFTIDNVAKPLAGVYRDLIHEYQAASFFNAPVFDFGKEFLPVITRRLRPECGIEQNQATTTWQSFTRYLNWL